MYIKRIDMRVCAFVKTVEDEIIVVSSLLEISPVACQSSISVQSARYRDRRIGGQIRLEESFVMHKGFITRETVSIGLRTYGKNR